MDPSTGETGDNSAFEREIAACCIARLDRAGVPWRASVNKGGEHAKSCMQAARHRDRLGSGDNGGIPLWAELKSIVGIARSGDSKAVPYAAHTRANTRIDDASLISALGLDPDETSLQSIFDGDADLDDGRPTAVPQELRERWFGLVNPFTANLVLSELGGLDLSLADVVQVFDVSLSLPGGVPDTVMTNLGDRTRAMELAPADLIDAVRRLSGATHVEEIAVPCPIWLGKSGKHQKDVFLNWPPPNGPRIGILTGNGPESGVMLWQDILATVRRLYPQVPDAFMPDVLVQSLPEMGLSMDLVAREEQVRETVLRGVRDLLRLDCRLVTVACNTTIYFEPEIEALCAEHGARFVSIAEAAVPAAARALTKPGTGVDVGLVGIGPVVDLDGGFSGYRSHLAAAGISVATREAAIDEFAASTRAVDEFAAATRAVEEFAYKIKIQPDSKTRAKAFGGLVRNLPATTCVVILALTEASIVFRRDVVPQLQKRGDPRTYIDALAELGEYLAFAYLVDGYLKSEVCQITEVPMIEGKLRELLGWADERSDPGHASRTAGEPQGVN